MILPDECRSRWYRTAAPQSFRMRKLPSLSLLESGKSHLSDMKRLHLKGVEILMEKELWIQSIYPD